MDTHTISYLIFIVALCVSFILDLVVFSKKNQVTTTKQAGYQYLFWVAISLAYGVYLWMQYDSHTSLSYFSAYLMEMSLSIDNIFVFVLIFTSLNVHKENLGRVLTIGVTLAILFRIIFIALGIALIKQFDWILYVFGAFLVYTGIKLFFQNPEQEADIKEGKLYKVIRKYLRYTDVEYEGKFTINKGGKVYFTKLALVVIIIGLTDIVFAVDSIPAVFAISTDNLVVFSSNIFAVLGLRALFFILQKAVDKFDFLQQGISVVLVFIGLKMFGGLVHIHIPIWLSLLVIVVCIGGSMLYSIYHNRKHTKHHV